MMFWDFQQWRKKLVTHVHSWNSQNEILLTRKLAKHQKAISIEIVEKKKHDSGRKNVTFLITIHVVPDHPDSSRYGSEKIRDR